MNFFQKFVVILRVRDVRLPMVLWGKFASDVTNAIQLLGEGRLILVLRFGKIKVWKGKFLINVHIGYFISLIITYRLCSK